MSRVDERLFFAVCVVGIFIAIVTGSVPFLVLAVVGLVITGLFRR